MVRKVINKQYKCFILMALAWVTGGLLNACSIGDSCGSEWSPLGFRIACVPTHLFEEEVLDEPGLTPEEEAELAASIAEGKKVIESLVPEGEQVIYAPEQDGLFSEPTQDGIGTQVIPQKLSPVLTQTGHQLRIYMVNISKRQIWPVQLEGGSEFIEIDPQTERSKLPILFTRIRGNINYESRCRFIGCARNNTVEVEFVRIVEAGQCHSYHVDIDPDYPQAAHYTNYSELTFMGDCKQSF